MDKNKWKKLKRSGHFRKKVKKTLEQMKYSAKLMQPNLISASNASEYPSASPPRVLSGSVDSSNEIINNVIDDGRYLEPGPYKAHTSDVVISSDIDSTEISCDSESSVII